jgi:hypothetical protein
VWRDAPSAAANSWRRPYRWLVAFSLGIAATTISAEAASASDTDRLTLAIRQLAGSQEPSGFFVFDMDFVAGRGNGSGKTRSDKTAYLVREAAAIYGLAKYALRAGDRALAPTLARAIEHLGAISLPVRKPTLEGWIERTGALSLPFGRVTLVRLLDGTGLLYQPDGPGRLVAHDGDYATAWVGGTALALVAELYFARASGDERFAGSRLAWRDGLLALGLPDGGFREYPGSIDETPIADGEAWLAFAVWADRFRDDAATVRRIDDHMIERYAAAPRIEFFHWGMMAAAQRLATTADVKFASFISRQAGHFLDTIALDYGADDNSCSFVEGLAAAMGALRASRWDDADLIRRLGERSEREMIKNRALQIEPAQQRFELEDGAFLWSPRLADFAGAVLAGRHEPLMRVDYTEHCISALLELQQGEAPR